MAGDTMKRDAYQAIESLAAGRAPDINYAKERRPNIALAVTGGNLQG